MSEPTGQHGSGTIIPADVSLIILDCFETLVEPFRRRYVARRGMREFLDHFACVRGIPVVVLSDGLQEAVDLAVEQSGLRERLAAVVGAPEAVVQMPDGSLIKRLDLMLERFGAERARCIFIGDSPLDARAAQAHRVPFIRVPRSEDKAFSFQSIIGGPSRYQSSEFSAVFLEEYLKRKVR